MQHGIRSVTKGCHAFRPPSDVGVWYRVSIGPGEGEIPLPACDVIVRGAVFHMDPVQRRRCVSLRVIDGSMQKVDLISSGPYLDPCELRWVRYFHDKLRPVINLNDTANIKGHSLNHLAARSQRIVEMPKGPPAVHVGVPGFGQAGVVVTRQIDYFRG